MDDKIVLSLGWHLQTEDKYRLRKYTPASIVLEDGIDFDPRELSAAMCSRADFSTVLTEFVGREREIHHRGHEEMEYMNRCSRDERRRYYLNASESLIEASWIEQVLKRRDCFVYAEPWNEQVAYMAFVTASARIRAGMHFTMGNVDCVAEYTAQLVAATTTENLMRDILLAQAAKVAYARHGSCVVSAGKLHYSVAHHIEDSIVEIEGTSLDPLALLIAEDTQTRTGIPFPHHIPLTADTRFNYVLLSPIGTYLLDALKKQGETSDQTSHRLNKIIAGLNRSQVEETVHQFSKFQSGDPGHFALDFWRHKGWIKSI